MPALSVFIFLLSTCEALAHGNSESGPAWTFDPWIVVPLVAAIAGYSVGYCRLRSRVTLGRRQMKARGILYLLGWVSLAGALVSPLHWLGEHLFTFHMVEHEIVIAVSAPLIVLARPAAVFLWAFSDRIRIAIGRAMVMDKVRFVWDWCTGGTVATVLHGLAIWIWHVPVFFDASVENVAVHRLQHLSFFLTAILFWWSILWVSRPGASAWHLFITMMHTGLLGALMALAPRVLYQVQTAKAEQWGLTPLEDQQLAGMIMWIPAGIVYAGAALIMVALLVHRAGRRQHA